MMKKVFIVLLSILMIVSLFGCSSNKMTTQPAETKQTQQSEVAPQSEEKGKTEQATAKGGKVSVIVWGINPKSVGSGNEEMIKAFNESHPNIELVPQSTPGGGGYSTQDLTKLLSAIAAGNPPDVVRIDRFTVVQFAARNALSPLDEYIKESGLDLNKFVGYSVQEGTFDGKVWALPWETDTRLLFWNKDIFKEAGLDPESPPKTRDELLEYGKKLTKYDDKGNYIRVGFIPCYGESKLYTLAFQNEAKIISDDGKTALLNAPEVVEALEWMVKACDELGGAKKLRGFSATFQGDANNPFLTGQIAMLITHNTSLNGYVKYRPDINFGCIVPPPPEGKKPVTWSGGWGFAIPKGAKHPKEAFEVIKWLVTEGILEMQKAREAYNKAQGADIYIPFPCAYLPANETVTKTYIDPIQNETIKKGVQVGIDAMQVSRCRPVCAVGETIWVELERATDKAIYHEMTPQEALDAANKVVQDELNKFWESYEYYKSAK